MSSLMWCWLFLFMLNLIIVRIWNLCKDKMIDTTATERNNENLKSLFLYFIVDSEQKRNKWGKIGLFECFSLWDEVTHLVHSNNLWWFWFKNSFLSDIGWSEARQCWGMYHVVFCVIREHISSCKRW